LIAEDVPGERKKLDREQAQQELRHGIKGELQAGGNVVARAVAPDRLVDPQRDGNQKRQQQ
jgi:hypothetical protein